MNSSILQSVLPLVFLLVNLFAIYLLLRGHNYPGGGFIAGLATGISLLLMVLTNRLFKEPLFFMRLGFIGLGIILIAGLIPLALGHAFLTHYVDSPVWPSLELLTFKTPLIFDTGVYLVVVAMVVKIYFLFRKAHLIWK
jgi:multisubunit Na+/H+ antiporter MnhB subunit